MTKKRFLFVGTGDIDESACINENHFALSVVEKLRQSYDISMIYHLVHFRKDILCALESNGYHALITHVPVDKSAFAEPGRGLGLLGGIFAFNGIYGESLGIIERIKEANPNLPIVAYTGSDLNLQLFNTGYFTEVVSKTDNADEDSDKLKKALEEILK